MIVIKAFNVNIPNVSSRLYTSDPYCVWWNASEYTWMRWPHSFEPTHWVELPEAPDV